jgi:hypothetical protein
LTAGSIRRIGRDQREASAPASGAENVDTGSGWVVGGVSVVVVVGWGSVVVGASVVVVVAGGSVVVVDAPGRSVVGTVGPSSGAGPAGVRGEQTGAS